MAKKRTSRVKIRNFLDPRYIAWRKAVYKRDSYQCQWPGCKKKSKLNAHHIMRWADYPTLRFIVQNGITLCYTHHKGIFGKEDLHTQMFMRILLNQRTKKK